MTRVLDVMSVPELYASTYLHPVSSLLMSEVEALNSPSLLLSLLPSLGRSSALGCCSGARSAMATQLELLLLLLRCCCSWSATAAPQSPAARAGEAAVTVASTMHGWTTIGRAVPPLCVRCTPFVCACWPCGTTAPLPSRQRHPSRRKSRSQRLLCSNRDQPQVKI